MFTAVLIIDPDVDLLCPADGHASTRCPVRERFTFAASGFSIDVILAARIDDPKAVRAASPKENMVVADELLDRDGCLLATAGMRVTTSIIPFCKAQLMLSL